MTVMLKTAGNAGLELDRDLAAAENLPETALTRVKVQRGLSSSFAFLFDRQFR